MSQRNPPSVKMREDTKGRAATGSFGNHECNEANKGDLNQNTVKKLWQYATLLHNISTRFAQVNPHNLAKNKFTRNRPIEFNWLICQTTPPSHLLFIFLACTPLYFAKITCILTRHP